MCRPSQGGLGGELATRNFLPFCSVSSGKRSLGDVVSFRPFPSPSAASHRRVRHAFPIIRDFCNYRFIVCVSGRPIRLVDSSNVDGVDARSFRIGNVNAINCVRHIIASRGHPLKCFRNRMVAHRKSTKEAFGQREATLFRRRVFRRSFTKV